MLNEKENRNFKLPGNSVGKKKKKRQKEKKTDKKHMEKNSPTLNNR